ncbi:Hypoticical protein [Pectobacterium parmentieri]|uniref:Hypoticical protein n=1 Tax=Pectobacterium parmentieri TaxID=1905730 RepID=A0A0H3I6T6_PECPM|nr:Hypoticical protein [Pectobacterium parmentieri]POW30671.1 hypothetical protein PB20LOC_00564 [Pectobacterium parmentieri]
MEYILVRHPASRCYATLENAPCTFLCPFFGKINNKYQSFFVFIIQNVFKILLEQRHLAGIFLFMLSIFN